MSIERFSWDPSVDMVSNDEGDYVRYSDHEKVISKHRADMQGYVEAFYEVASMLGMTAQACSPQQAWSSQMRPYLERLIYRQPLMKIAGYTFTDDPAVYAMPGSGFHPGTEPPEDAVNVVAVYASDGNPPQENRQKMEDSQNERI